MKICPRCKNKEADDGAVFCSECGFRFQPTRGRNMMYSPTSLDDESTGYKGNGKEWKLKIL